MTAVEKVKSEPVLAAGATSTLAGLVIKAVEVFHIYDFDQEQTIVLLGLWGFAAAWWARRKVTPT